MKDATFADFARTIRSVAAGVSVLPPTLTGSLFSQIIARVPGEDKASLIVSVRMTKREREVIELIAEGLSNKDIAQRLNIATYTVKSHVAQSSTNWHCTLAWKCLATPTPKGLPELSPNDIPPLDSEFLSQKN